MDLNFLDFEQPIAELEAKIDELRHVGTDVEINIQDGIATLETKSRDLTESIFSNLKPWQISRCWCGGHRKSVSTPMIFDDWMFIPSKADVRSG